MQQARELPGSEGVTVVLRVASCIASFKLISFVGGQGGPKDYVKEVSSSLGNFHIEKILISDFRNKHLHFLECAVLSKCYKI